MINTLSAAIELADKLEKYGSLLELLEWDNETKTLTIDSSVTIKVKGTYTMETDKHLFLNSNWTEMDKEIGIPYSVLFNTPEVDLRKVKDNIDNILNMKNDGDCGCH